MNTTPSVIILSGIAAGLLLPIVLALLSHGPWKVSAPGTRFWLSTGLISAAWVVFLTMQPTIVLADALASAMIWLTAVLVEFSFWCLLAWGFTVSLLVSLARAPGPITFDQWVAAYTGGGTLETFARDRLSLLLRVGLAQVDGENVRLVPGWGQWLAALVRLLRQIFGVRA